MRLATPTPPWEENGAAAGLNHQLYVTHCLYDEGLSREAGFGVRAGSTRDPLTLRFALEYPPYELPLGVEAGDEAPRRLALVRVPGGRSVLIHSAPVSPDERGRANNFFSHVIIGSGLTVCEALASWASPEWAVDCPSSASKVIPPRSGLPRGAAVHDQAVTDFLRAPGRTADPGLDDLTCPPHLAADRSRRRRLLALTLRGCLLALQAGPAAPRGRFTLLAEPGLVALLLYAAARLLPQGLAEGLTFSTYEHALTTLPSSRHAQVVGTWLADPGRGLDEVYYTRLGYALDTFNDKHSEELAADLDPALEEWLELAARGEWAAIDRLHGLLGKATTIAGYKDGVQAARLARRVISGNADADDLLALKRSPLGRPIIAEQHEQLWPTVRDGSLTDPRLREAFADLIRENLPDLERRAARLLREPSGNWQPYWRVIGSALQDAPVLLREALERILPEPPYPADLCLAVLAELQSQRPAEDRPRVPPHALLKTFDGEELDRFARSPLPREWFIWAVYYALLRPASRDDAARHVHKGDDELVRLFWQQFRLLKDAGQRRAILGALVDTVGDHGPTFLGRLITSGCVLRPDALSWLLEALGAYGREWAEFWGRDDHLGRLLDRVRTFGDEGGPIWDRFAAEIDRGVLPPGDPYQGALLLNLVAVARRPGPALPRPAVEAIADWSLLRDHFEKASGLAPEARAAVIDACNRRRLDPIEELTTYFARFVQSQTVTGELLDDFAGFFHSFFPEPCEYPDHSARLVGWLRLVADGPDPVKTEAYQRYYLQHFVPEEFRRRLAEEVHRAGKLLPAVWETWDDPPEMTEMGTDWASHAVRWLALLALALSTALLVHYVRPNPRLCGYESDCDAVLNSPFARGLGVSLPLAGVVGFATLFAATLFPDRRIGRLRRPLALAAGAGGLILLLVQGFVVERLCRYCAVVDLSAVAIGVVQLAWGGRASATIRFRPLWLAGGVVAAGLGAAFGAAGGWPSRQDQPPPPQVTALWVEGKVNVVEVADFQCPHCRRMHAVVSRFLTEEGDRIHFVRLAVPMPAHPQARDAARAFRCAGAEDKGDLMAEELFRASDLSPATCEGIAARLGLSMPAFRGCVADTATDAAINADLAWVKTASPRGLPVVWVQGQMLQGLQPIEALREAARIAERRRASGAVKED